MYCPTCGQSNEPGVKYCVNCGSKLEFKEAVNDDIFDDDVVVTERVSGNESVYREVINNMQEIYQYTSEEPYIEEYIPKERTHIIGLLSMIFSFVALLLSMGCCCSFLRYPGVGFGVLALIFGVVSLIAKEKDKGFAITGISVGCLVLLFGCAYSALNIAINVISSNPVTSYYLEEIIEDFALNFVNF